MADVQFGKQHQDKKLIGMSLLRAGQMGVVVKSPFESHIGLVVMGGLDGPTNKYVFCLSTGDYWIRPGVGIQVRILSPDETVTLRNE
jgi:hypothetical protein